MLATLRRFDKLLKTHCGDSLNLPSSHRRPAEAACDCDPDCWTGAVWRCDAPPAGQEAAIRCGPAGPPKCRRDLWHNRPGSAQRIAPTCKAFCFPSAPEWERRGKISLLCLPSYSCENVNCSIWWHASSPMQQCLHHNTIKTNIKLKLCACSLTGGWLRMVPGQPDIYQPETSHHFPKHIYQVC